jgi:pyruvate formate lyase activating enzyme
MRTDSVKGVVFNLQHYSIHDGPGIRTTGFLKGCPLKCLWCQNPESQDSQPILFFTAEKCSGCGSCVEACPNEAIGLLDNKSKTDRDRCTGKGECVFVSPNDARRIVGREMTAEEVFEDIKTDDIFYRASNGGVTLSGGDPVFQPDFSIAILGLCQSAGIHTAIETCGFLQWSRLKEILEYTDLVLYDIKHMNSSKHKEYTGVTNELILENAEKIHRELKLPIYPRIPLISGYNDSLKNLQCTAEFIASKLDGKNRVYILPYHRLGENKYKQMERRMTMNITPPSDTDLENARKIFESTGLSVVIGG